MQQFGRNKVANRDLPVSSRAAHQKWVDHCHELHRHRLQTIKPAIDNKWGGSFAHGQGKQPTYPHLAAGNAKKLQQQGDLQAERELENYILLAKLSKILQRPPPDTQSNPYKKQGAGAPGRAARGPSRNRDAELRRIHADNLRIVHRIQSTRPHISVTKLERDYEQSLEYKEMISMFSDHRLSKGSTVTPSPRVAAINDGSQSARTRSRPSSANHHRAPVPRSRPSSAGARMMMRRQVEASEYKAALHERQRGRAGPGEDAGPPMPYSVWSEEPTAVPEEGGGVAEGEHDDFSGGR